MLQVPIAAKTETMKPVHPHFFNNAEWQLSWETQSFQ